MAARVARARQELREARHRSPPRSRSGVVPPPLSRSRSATPPSRSHSRPARTSHSIDRAHTLPRSKSPSSSPPEGQKVSWTWPSERAVPCLRCSACHAEIPDSEAIFVCEQCEIVRCSRCVAPDSIRSMAGPQCPHGLLEWDAKTISSKEALEAERYAGGGVATTAALKWASGSGVLVQPRGEERAPGSQEKLEAERSAGSGVATRAALKRAGSTGVQVGEASASGQASQEAELMAARVARARQELREA